MQGKVKEEVHTHWKLQVVELKVLGLLSSSIKFSGVPDYWVPDGILLYWEVIWWEQSCMLYRIVITSVLGHCLQRLIWVRIVIWSELWNIKICAHLEALLTDHIIQPLYYSGMFTVIQIFWYIKGRWIWLRQIHIMIHIIVINLIKIVNCGKDYVMMRVCVQKPHKVHNYISWNIYTCNNSEYSISLQRPLS